MTDALRILLVEDDVDDAAIAQIVLKRESAITAAAGVTFQVDHIASVREAKDHAAKKFDAILLDLNIADSIGAATYDRISAIFPNIPIVVVTATNDPDVIKAILEAGAREFVSKLDGYGHLTSTVYLAVLRVMTDSAPDIENAIIGRLADIM